MNNQAWKSGKTFDEVKVGPAAPLDCEECGEAFPWQDFDLVACAGCGELALVCPGCLDSLATDEHDEVRLYSRHGRVITPPSTCGKPRDTIKRRISRIAENFRRADEFPPEVNGCRWMNERRNWAVTYRFGSILADGVVPARPYLELERRHFRQRTLQCDFWQITRGTCSHVAQDSEFAKRSLDLVERALGKDTPSDIPSLEEVVLVKAIDSVKDWLADPVKCEECGEQFVRKFLEQVVCEECDEEMSVCKECVDSLVMDRAPALP